MQQMCVCVKATWSFSALVFILLSTNLSNVLYEPKGLGN